MMNAVWFADRLRLYALIQQYPQWGSKALAAACGRSVRWVATWRQRFGSPPHPDPLICCQQRSSARRTPPPSMSPTVVAAIITLRQTLSAALHRVAGPKTILYHLHQDPSLSGEVLPQSATTIWKILDQHHGIVRPPHRQRKPLDRPPPMTEIEIDFTDIPTIPCTEGGKRQHAADVFNWVDRGTSIPIASITGDDFAMETTIRSSVALLQTLGVPPSLRCDRDPRFVGYPDDDFPSAFLRVWAALAVPVEICPPHRPDTKPSVERYHRILKEACLRPARPHTVDEAQAVIDPWREAFVLTRLHQGSACQNRPPAVAFPHLPVWKRLPVMVDPDAWLRALDGAVYVRRVTSNGMVQLDTRLSSVGRALAGQSVVLRLHAASAEVVVYHEERELRRHPLKGVIGSMLPFEHYVALLCGEARSATVRVRVRQERWQRRAQRR